MPPEPAEVRLPTVRDMRPDRALSRLRTAVMVAHDLTAYALQDYGKRSKQYREAVREEEKAETRLRRFKRLCGME